MRVAPALVGAWILLIATSGAHAQEFFIYPDRGQSDEQMEQDKFQCYGWAKNQSGFDPMALATATAPPPKQQQPKGGVARGAVGGALIGTAVGAISGKRTGKAAAAGAAAGGLIGGMRRNDQVRQEQADRKQWEQEQVANYQRSRNNYNRAYAACLEGRGYTVR